VNNRQVLELSNTSREPLAIHPGVRICQFIFERTEGHAIMKECQGPGESDRVAARSAFR
jgi:deoxycytidine triphosphate deaminase